MKLDQEQNQLIQEFSKISSWEGRYQRIIELGRQLPPMPEEFKIDDLKVKGCQSQVWLKADLRKDPNNSEARVYFIADSDALIVKGLVAILLKVYSGRTPKEILELSPDFIRELGFESNLSPSRANGLQAMIKQIKFYALAYSTYGSVE